MGVRGCIGVRRAVFLDRDGVLNRNVVNPATGNYESPLTVQQFEILPGVFSALRQLNDAGYLLFLVSNQPNYVNGKGDLFELDAIHEKLRSVLEDERIPFAAFYYCRHHPQYTGECGCRKPSPYFIFQAGDEFSIALYDSWMIGDRATDIACGRNARTKTLLITEEHIVEIEADYIAPDLLSAVQIIMSQH